jgi:hypothetical protein
MKSQYKGIGNDTLLRCILFILVFVGFYFWVYNFKYEAPDPRKIEWHRTVAAGMAGAAVFFAVGEYSVHLWRRIKARQQNNCGDRF